ncbi:MAG: hypothetical protein PHN89_03940 [Candidatus Pacebacteria bacterium]|nr:hypothetical protein [Candidatus Paceibacterota bacterium]
MKIEFPNVKEVLDFTEIGKKMKIEKSHIPILSYIKVSACENGQSAMMEIFDLKHGVRKIFSGSNFTHQLPRVSEECRDYIYEIYPKLERVAERLMESRGEWGNDEKKVSEWVEKMRGIYGAKWILEPK